LSTVTNDEAQDQPEFPREARYDEVRQELKKRSNFNKI
jgi:hypothetical protein